MGTAHEDVRTFIVVSTSSILKIKNLAQNLSEKIKTHISFSTTFSRKSVTQMVEAPSYKTEGRGFDSRWYH
jgi:hypothetical protein